MIAFGAITIDVSHPKRFSSILQAGNRGRYTAVFNDGFRETDEVQGFAKSMNLKICTTLEELADTVDIGMIHCCNWDKHLQYIRAFADRGKPVFIDKPLVGNLRDAARLLELTASGVKILGTSALRYCREVQSIRRQVEQAGAKVLHVDAAVGVDDFNYAIHGFETICTLMADKPVSAAYLGSAASQKEHCDHYLLRFARGGTAVLHNFGKKYTQFHTMVLTDQGTDLAFTIDNGSLYDPMLDYICDELEGKENPLASMEEMLVPITAALACRASKLADGAEIRLDDPVLETVSFDGHAFEQEYAAAARRMYIAP